MVKNKSTPASSVAKKCKRMCRLCDAKDAIERIDVLSPTKVCVTMAAGWETVLPQKGDDDPGLLIMWNIGNLEQTVANINAAGVGAAPAWMGAGPVDEHGLMISILTELRAQAGTGGVVGNCVIAPNDLFGWSRLRDTISYLFFDPSFIAHAVAPLGDVYVLADRKHNGNAERAPTVAPPVGAAAVHLFH